MLHCSKALFYIPAAIFILVAFPFLAFPQLKDAIHSQLVLQLQKSKADTNRVSLLLKLGQYYIQREYYLYKTGNPHTQPDSACYFAAEALQLSQALKYEKGRNEAILIKGDALLRKNDTRSALNLLGILGDSTRFRLLVILSRHYLFHTGRTKKDLDSSRLFLEQANSIAQAHLSEKGQQEPGGKAPLYYFNAGDIPQGKILYKEITGNISQPGNEEMEARLWQDHALLIQSRDTSGITRMYCFEKMLSLYIKTGNEEKEIAVLESIADMHMTHGMYVLAETELLNVIQRYKKINYSIRPFTYNLLAATYSKRGDFAKGILYGLKAVESMEATHDYSSAPNFYSHLGHMYRELGQPEKSVAWYWKLFNNLKFSEKSNMYYFRDAGHLARELIKLKKEKEALAFILDIEARNKPIGPHAQASLLVSLAYCYHIMDRHQQAERYYLKLAKLTDQLQKNNEITTEVYYELGHYFLDKRQYGKATYYLQKALNASDGINTLSITKDIYMMLYRADSGTGNWNAAAQHLLQHKLFNDSIFNETKSRQIEELQVQYETVKKEKDIKLLNNQNQLQRIRVEQANKAKNIILAAAALLLIIVGLIFNRYLLKQRINRKLEANQKELDQKNLFLETLINEQDKLLKEKEWLIREVHHRVKNNLQMVTGLLYSQSIYLEDEAARLAVNDSLRRMQAMSLIHQKLYQDENISTIAMPAYINDLVRYLHESFDAHSQITFEQTIESLELDVSQAIPVGLIITESIVNAIKYAFLNGQKGVVSLHLQYESTDHLLLKISDNGIGLPAGLDMMEHHSLGLDLMQGLTRQLKGTIHIESNNGVHISVRFKPLVK